MIAIAVILVAGQGTRPDHSFQGYFLPNAYWKIN